MNSPKYNIMVLFESKVISPQWSPFSCLCFFSMFSMRKCIQVVRAPLSYEISDLTCLMHVWLHNNSSHGLCHYRLHVLSTNWLSDYRVECFPYLPVIQSLQNAGLFFLNALLMIYWYHLHKVCFLKIHM